MDAITRSIEAVGGQVHLARRLGITPAAVNQWVRGLRPVPAERCRAIEAATAGVVTRYDLRPDVFGPAPANDAQSTPQPEAAHG